MIDALQLQPNVPAQALRFRRYLIAVGTSGMVVILLGFSCWQGVLPKDAFIRASWAIFAWVCLFYGLFRSGWNRKMPDPSLTAPQILAACSVLLYVVYEAEEARGIFLIMFLFPLLFGVFRLRTRGLLGIAISVLIGYAGIIALLAHQRPLNLNLRLELLQWVILAAALCWAAIMGGYVTALRNRLRESRARYQEVFDSIHEVIFQTDAEGRWILLNPAWQNATGIAVEQTLGRLMLEYIRDEDRPQIERCQASLREGELTTTRCEMRFTRRDGNIGWAEVTQRARIDEQGRFAGTSGIMEDITERKVAALAMKNLNVELEKRVQERTAELEAFSYSVSHDLRAPLRAIGGFSHMLEEDHADKLDDESKNYLARIRAATQRMGTLIDNLLELGRIIRADLDLQAVDLSDIARTIFRDLSDEEPQRQVEIAVGADLVAHADPALMRIVLDNLLRNAWKFTMRCEHARIVVDATTRNCERVFFVRDNGAGFDMAHASHLFKAFQRLHAPGEFTGTGIGLATVQRVIQRHGGRIWAEAELDRGATFYFTLPQTQD